MKRALTPSNVRFAFEVVLVVAVLSLALSHGAPTEAAPALEPAVPNATYWYTCNTSATMNIGLFTNRIHAFCASTTPIGGAPALPGIFWFAVPTAPDSAGASRFLSMFQSAAITGKTLWFQLDPSDTSGTAFGCGAGDCRRIVSAELR